VQPPFVHVISSRFRQLQDSQPSFIVKDGLPVAQRAGQDGDAA
jgi:hypothetical protein